MIVKAILSTKTACRPNVLAMKKAQTAFAERLRQALARVKIDASPGLLQKLVARHGGTPVTAQAISGWLSGKHMPKHDNMCALAKLLDMTPSELQFGGKPHGLREPRAAWPPDVTGLDRLAWDEFRTLSAEHRKVVREMIAALVSTGLRQGKT